MVKPNDIRIGDLVAYRIGEKNLSTPMTVVGIFSCKSDLDKATVYLDFEGNDGDVFEVEIEDIVEVIELKQGEC